MFTEETLFYIPIYPQTKKQYFVEIKEDFEKSEKKSLKEIENEENKKYFLDNKRKKSRYNRWAQSENFSNWELNQIIGWIEFYAHSSKLKANLWFIDSGRITKRPKNKSMVLKGRLGEVTDLLDIKKNKLHSEITKFVDEVRKGEYGYKYLKKYYIPDKIFLPNISLFDVNKLYDLFTEK